MGRQSKREGRQPIIWPKFAENCMKLEKIGPGARPKFYYVDPPLLTICKTIEAYSQMIKWQMPIKASNMDQDFLDC